MQREEIMLQKTDREHAVGLGVYCQEYSPALQHSIVTAAAASPCSRTAPKRGVAELLGFNDLSINAVDACQP